MVSYRNSDLDPGCESVGGTVFLGNVVVAPYVEPDTGIAVPATALLSIDVIAAPGSQSWMFHFVTLHLRIEAPAEARFVAHSARGNYHREVPVDPSAELGLDPDSLYWQESDAASVLLRVREDQTSLLAGSGNGRTYYVGISGFDPRTQALRLQASASASLARETSCALVIEDLREGERIPGYLD